jgi:hypothetical protein
MYRITFAAFPINHNVKRRQVVQDLDCVRLTDLGRCSLTKDFTDNLPPTAFGYGLLSIDELEPEQRLVEQYADPSGKSFISKRAKELVQPAKPITYAE